MLKETKRKRGRPKADTPSSPTTVNIVALVDAQRGYTVEAIAQRCRCSERHVRQTIKRWRPECGL